MTICGKMRPPSGTRVCESLQSRQPSGPVCVSDPGRHVSLRSGLLRRALASAQSCDAVRKNRNVRRDGRHGGLWFERFNLHDHERRSMYRVEWACEPVLNGPGRTGGKDAPEAMNVGEFHSVFGTLNSPPRITGPGTSFPNLTPPCNLNPGDGTRLDCSLG